MWRHVTVVVLGDGCSGYSVAVDGEDVRRNSLYTASTQCGCLTTCDQLVLGARFSRSRSRSCSRQRPGTTAPRDGYNHSSTRRGHQWPCRNDRLIAKEGDSPHSTRGRAGAAAVPARSGAQKNLHLILPVEPEHAACQAEATRRLHGRRNDKRHAGRTTLLLTEQIFTQRATC